MGNGLVEGADGRCRCGWGASTDDYAAYHDGEWGRPVADDRRLFEKLCLEGFQSGLAWITILRKRPAFRAAFAGFDPAAVAAFDGSDVDRLLADAGIVRHRGKIEATIANARATVAVQARHGSLAAFVWGFEPPPDERPAVVDRAAIVATTPASTRLSKALKGAGFRFVGPTTAHAFMQAMGLVNDHLDGCWVRAEVEAERARFVRPSPGSSG
ncbi:MAG: DNA-3-methyladenine glycosylase I [Myxococcota bacterium]